MKYKKLSPEEARVIIHKGTEPPYSGEYTKTTSPGTYLCRQCGKPLFRSEDKFISNCGWPSFDDALPDAVREIPDSDGVRTEIVCSSCGGHLGHVFRGEGFTKKSIRHCVNSISMIFIADKALEKAYFGAGCFWGVEALFKTLDGVEGVVSGYMGGELLNPTYEDVCRGDSGHAEVVEVTYDPVKIGYRDLAKFFFEIHDPSQRNRQGPDSGEQYRSVAFISNSSEHSILESLIFELKSKGFKVETIIEKRSTFYKAEPYHQNYYERTGSKPYCHFYKAKF